MKFRNVLSMVLLIFFSNALLGQISTPKPIEPFEMGKIMQAKLLDENLDHIVPTLTDVELWSAIISTDSLLEIVYQPANYKGDLMADNGDDNYNEYDLNSPAFQLAKQKVIELVLKNNTETKDTSMIVYEDDEDPIIVLRVNSYKSVYALRNSNNVYDLAFGGIMNAKFEEDIQNGLYTLPLRNELYIDGLLSGGNPNKGSKKPLTDWTPWWIGELFSIGCDNNPAPNINLDPDHDGTLRVPWHYTEMGIPEANYCSAGAGVRIALLDTGVSEDQERLGSEFNSGYSPRTIHKITTFPSGITDDECGHGTLMAGVIAGPQHDTAVRGIAYKSDLVSVRSNKDVLIFSWLSKFRIKKALKVVRKGWDGTVGVKIISMSFGYLYFSRMINRQLRKLDKQGMLMFGAIGTSGLSYFLRGFQVRPAKNKRVLGVTGIETDFPNNGLEICSKCHHGNKVKFVVPMQWEDGVTHSLMEAGAFPATVGGSSIATATMAGVAAMVWALPENANKSDEEIRDILIAASTTPNFLNTPFGHGVVDVGQAMGCVGPETVVQLEHEDGTPGIEFGCAEEIFLDASGSTNNNNAGHFLRLKCIEDDGGLTTIAETAWNAPFPGSLPLLNITDIFDNEEEQVTYKAGKSYQLTFGMFYPDFGWQYKYLEFTLLADDSKKVVFHLEDVNGVAKNEFLNCEDIYLNSSATDLSYAGHFLRLNGIENGEVVHPAIVETTWHAPFPGTPPIFNMTEIFEEEEEEFEYEVGKTYQILLGIKDTYCGWIYETHTFTLVENDKEVLFQLEHADGTVDIEFSICEDMFLNSSASTIEYTGHYLRLSHVDETGVGIWPPIAETTWGPDFPGAPPIFNYTQIFEEEEEEFEYVIGETYQALLGLKDVYCGWIYEWHNFTVVAEETPPLATGLISNWCNGDAVNETTVLVTGTPDCTDITETDGIYDCSNTVDYMIRPTKDINGGNGVSTADLNLVTQYLAGLNPFTSPFQLIAADVDNSQSITDADFTAIANVVLSLTDEFPNNTSWRFHDALAPISFDDPFTTIKEFIVEENCRANNDFLAIKIGDVNCTANSQLKGGAENKIAYLQNKQKTIYKKGDKITVPLTFTAAKNILALQLGIQFDTKALTYAGFKNIQLADFEGSNYNAKIEGEFRLYWVSDDPENGQVISNNNGFVELTFVANSTIDDVSKYLLLQELPYVKSEIYFNDLSIENLMFVNALSDDFIKSNGQENQLDFEQESLADNWVTVFPNPVQNNLTFKSAKSNLVEASILNTQFQAIKVLSKADLENGEIDFTSITPGIYFLKFTNQEGEIAIKKIVRMK